MSIDTGYTIDILMRLLRTPSVTGDCEAAVRLCEEEFARLGVPTRRTKKGSLIAELGGEGGPVKVVSGHVDTLGAMVKEILADGRLRLTNIGGLPAPSCEGAYCWVLTADGRRIPGTILPKYASTHVYGPEYGKLERTWENMVVRLDERTESAEATRALGVEVGDVVALDPRAEHLPSGYIKSRFLDDKAAVATMFAALKALADSGRRPSSRAYFYISTYEEVGHGCPAGTPEDAEEFLAVDMAAVGEGQRSSEHAVTICAKDSSGPYDLALLRRLVRLCQERGIRHAVDIYPYYSSDASAALQAGRDVRAGLVGPGVDASHTHERTHVDALAATAELLLAYLTESRRACGAPGFGEE
ncbi:MAG: M42 family metallopeptidase [Firmicutes bacterium]|nr:M42 family metallopeptidase [Bacillota bacterium]